jgi:Fe-S cluster biogenesis protein NfuA
MQAKKEFTLEEQMRGLVEQLDAYIDTYHGGSVEFVSYNDKIVKVRLGKACIDCPLSTQTLKGWIEGTFKQFFPEEVKAVENADQ